MDEIVVVKIYIKGSEDSNIDLSPFEEKLSYHLKRFNLIDQPNVTISINYNINNILYY